MKRENKKDCPECFFEISFSLLPIMAEEGNLQQGIAFDDIDAQSNVKLGCSREEAVGRRLNWQRLLQAFCLLDERALDQGLWRFVSFPASLFARSLAMPKQAFFQKTIGSKVRIARQKLLKSNGSSCMPWSRGACSFIRRLNRHYRFEWYMWLGGCFASTGAFCYCIGRIVTEAAREIR